MKNITFWLIPAFIVAVVAGYGYAISKDAPDITLEAYGHIPPDEHAETFCRADGGVEAVFQDEEGQHRFVVCAGGAVSGRYDLKP